MTEEIDEPDIELEGSESTSDDDEEPRDPHLHRAGTILQIKLINFMCHSSFEIEFGPRVNFVIGPNGSGKSAILTALVVAFGARAAVTNRAKKMDEFIKYGEQTARVIIKLHNYNDLTDKGYGYKPEEYGQFIFVEKIIDRTANSRLLIKNSKGRVVAEKRYELDSILDHFRIQVENPVCILNQEVSKTFLHSKKPEDKFNLFMKATLLEQIREDYSESQGKFDSWKLISNEKKAAWKRLKGEKSVVLDKIERIKKRDTLEQEREDLINELMWSGYKDLQIKEKEARTEVLSITEKISEIGNKTKLANRKIERLKEEIESERVASSTVNQDRNRIRKMMLENRTDLVKKRELKKLKEGDLRRNEQELKNLTRDKEELENKINQLQSQSLDKRSRESERQNRKNKIISLETEIRELQSRESSTRTQAKHLAQTLTQLRSELSAESSRKMDLSSKISRLSSDLNRITNGKENSLRKFGEHMIEIRKEIDRAYASGKFKQKPIGPLGHYIKLKNKDVATALEFHLRSNLFAFACDSMMDMQVLTQILRRSFPTVKPPQMIVRPFGKRHDISQYKVEHEEFDSFVDLIEVEDDVVFNVLIDKCSLENVLYIPSYEEAENIMMNSHLVPQNCRCAYTIDACVMYPKTGDSGYRSYANDGRRPIVFAENVDDQIRELEDEKKLKETAYQDTCHKWDRLSEQHLTLKAESEQNEKLLRSIIDSIKPKDMELLDLKHVIDDSPVEVACFEEEVNTHINKIEELKPAISDIKMNIEMLIETIKDLEDRKKEMSAEEKQCDDKLRDLEEHVSKMATDITKHEKTIEDLKRQKHDQEEKLKSKQEELDKLMMKIADAEQSLQDKTEVSNPRDLAVVRADLRKKEIMLDQPVDYEDPEIEIKNLERRLIEIDSVEIKMTTTEQNVKSFNRALKVRKAGYQNLRDFTISKLSATFSSVMSSMNMRGELLIYVEPLYDSDGTEVKKANTLEIRVDTSHETTGSQISQPLPLTNRQRSCNLNNKSSTQGASDNNNNKNNAPSQHMSDSRSLSGGERSFSTVAFVLALWKHCAAPFKLLDEIDVFMDMVTRRISYNALINFASIKEENTGQYIFFSPLELPKIQDPSLVRVFEMPAPHRQAGTSDGTAGNCIEE